MGPERLVQIKKWNCGPQKYPWKSAKVARKLRERRAKAEVPNQRPLPHELTSNKYMFPFYVLYTYVFPGVLNFCFSVNIYVFGSKGDFLYPTAFFEFCKVWWIFALRSQTSTSFNHPIESILIDPILFLPNRQKFQVGRSSAGGCWCVLGVSTLVEDWWSKCYECRVQLPNSEEKSPNLKRISLQNNSHRVNG